MTRLLSLLLLLLLSACTDPELATSPSPPAQDSPNHPHLKYTQGIRTVFEDSQGNRWFGTHAEGAARVTEDSITYYTVADGLTSQQIRNVYEDRRGNIWFEGAAGLSYYDGDTIRAWTRRDFSEPDNWDGATDDLWFKEYGARGFDRREGGPGVYHYDGKNLSFRAFPVAVEAGQSNYYSVTTRPTRSPDGTLWFGTYGAVFGLRGKEVEVIDNDRAGLGEATGFLHVRSLYADSRGTLWIGNNGLGVLRYADGELTNFSKEQGFSAGTPATNALPGAPRPGWGGGPPVLLRVFSIGEDAEGNIWFGTAASGAYRYDGETLTHYGPAEGLPLQLVLNVHLTEDGELWLSGAEPSGVYRFMGVGFARVY